MDYGFNEFQKEVKQEPINPAIETPKEKEKKKINFQELPKDTEKILNDKESQRHDEVEQVMPFDDNQNQSHLSLILSPNLRDLELMIRGLEYVKKWNNRTQKDEIVLRKIKDHPLNDYGINKILELIRTFVSAELKLGRKRPKDAIESAQEVGHAAERLIYKNLKNFGMDTQVKQRNAKLYGLAIFEYVYAAYTRSIEGRENDASRPTAFEIQGSTELINDPNLIYNKKMKENMKN